MLAHHLASSSLALQGMFFGSVRGGGGVGRGSIDGIGYALWAGWLIVCGVVGVLV